ncbi:hypothetical protein JCM19231_1847 [Vibrio ishigakensis]|uniref:Uncharacterized protein n=1 Tax=Vibrio ishigakensis TaxID=1481914 RepID=A0A0B8NSM0_9VIBR|nr:hypothetical protein JCM19231_1847 [Vibrio ishigakensis]
MEVAKKLEVLKGELKAIEGFEALCGDPSVGSRIGVVILNIIEMS